MGVYNLFINCSKFFKVFFNFSGYNTIILYGGECKSSFSIFSSSFSLQVKGRPETDALSLVLETPSARTVRIVQKGTEFYGKPHKRKVDFSFLCTFFLQIEDAFYIIIPPYGKTHRSGTECDRSMNYGGVFYERRTQCGGRCPPEGLYRGCEAGV